MSETVEELAREFSHLHGSKDRASVLELLVAIMRLQLDPRLGVDQRQRVEAELFRAVCERLNISSCCLDGVLALAKLCCYRARGVLACGCLPFGKRPQGRRG